MNEKYVVPITNCIFQYEKKNNYFRVSLLLEFNNNISHIDN